jgi:hypothetical protein
MVTPAAGREAVAHLRGGFAMSERRACRVVALDRSNVRYLRLRPDDDPLRERLKVLADAGGLAIGDSGCCCAGKTTLSPQAGLPVYRLYKKSG